MNIYLVAMLKVACDNAKCAAEIGSRCKGTSSVVHPNRRTKAMAAGHWNVTAALAGEYGDLAGCPLEAIRR